jgi:hypothetical protein
MTAQNDVLPYAFFGPLIRLTIDVRTHLRIFTFRGYFKMQIEKPIPKWQLLVSLGRQFRLHAG